MAKKRLTLSPGRIAAGGVISLLAVWRLADVAAVPQSAFLLWPLRLVLLAAFGLLTARLLTEKDARLRRVAYALGFVFACFSVLGRQMTVAQALPAGWKGLWLLLDIAVYTVVFSAVVWLLYRLMLRRSAGAPKEKTGKPGVARRLLGNWFFVFFLLLLCWVPVWLAYYPGTLKYDSVTQFYTYIDDCMTTHHPLLHTLLLGSLLDYGVTLDSLTLGVALYGGVQIVLMAAIVAYACVWLMRRKAPFGLCVTVLILFALYPLYSLWAFSATKDVLFGGLVLLTCLQMADLWREGVNWFRSPVRVIVFILTTVLMMLMRNNGVYALCIALPFMVLAAQNRRVLTAALLIICLAGYAGGNRWLVSALNAEKGSYVEAISTPLQQVMRAAEYGEISAEDRETLTGLFASYDGDFADLYQPMCADNVKWNLDGDMLADDLPGYLALWWRVGLQNPRLYAEAFLLQNLPYYEPGSYMENEIATGLLPVDMYELEANSLLPGLKQWLDGYDRELTLFGWDFTKILTDNALAVWLTLLLLGWGIYRRRRGLVMPAIFLLAVWVTCLLGPVALMRYMLGFFYTVPVLLAYAFLKPEPGTETEPANT